MERKKKERFMHISRSLSRIKQKHGMHDPATGKHSNGTVKHDGRIT